jgi:predicted ATP-dependent endonuclease of OLD family
VLLIVTRLVGTVEERTLVLIDEPEAHLHPPLLSAFVRTLSELLSNRNGVAVIATHSPVVLQEVPKSCVWKIRRNGTSIVAERPEIETFGENVGILTREVFGLEVTHSGFHKLLYDAVVETGDFDDAVHRFGGELGGEAKAILRRLVAARREDEF